MSLMEYEESEGREAYRCDVARCSFSRYDCGACLRNTLNLFSSFLSFRCEGLLFFFDGEESSIPASEVRSTTGTFPFCTKDVAVLLRFFETGAMGDESSAKRVGGSSAMALGAFLGVVLVIVLALV